MYSVSSAFLSLAAQKNVRWQRQLLIGTSDYSAYVTKWPSLSKKWDDLRPMTPTIEAANEGSAFGFLLSNPAAMHADVALKLGIEVAVGSVEYITPFAGKIDATRYQSGGCSLTLADKFKRLTERKIGDSTTPAAYTSSAHFVHDLAWYVCSSLAGLSGVASASNPDLDYQSWASWSSVFSADNVRMKANFTGQNPLEIMKKIGVLTQSAVFIENDRIKFVRFSLVGSDSASLTSANVIDVGATLDDRDLINKAWVSADYQVSSRYFTISVCGVNSSSISSNSLREKLYAENFVWLTDSVSALNLAQRMIETSATIKPRLSVKVPLHEASIVTIGDTLALVDPFLGLNSSYRVMGESLDMDAGSKIFDIDRTQYKGAFTLDVSELDGTDILT